MGVGIKLKGSRIKYPNYCPCCGDHKDLSTQTFGVSEQGVHESLDFPYCNTCIDHAKTYNSYTKYFAGIIPVLIAFIFPYELLVKEDPYRSILFFGFLLLGVFAFFYVKSYNQQRAIKKSKKGCVTENWAIKLETPTFIYFDNSKYGNDFRSINDLDEI
jgi:hypothetical protein